MPRNVFVVLVSFIASALIASGCRLMELETKGKSPLQPINTDEDSVALEIFSARFPYGNLELNGKLWDQIDEQVFSADTRRELAQNGMRAGIVGIHVPAELIHLLKLTGEPPKQQEEQIVNLEEEPTVTRELSIWRSGKPRDLVVSHSYERIPLLSRSSGGLEGHNYTQATGHLALRATALADGRIEIDLLPELHHGQLKHNIVLGENGVSRLEAGQAKRLFNELQLKTNLAPGQMLVMTCQADRPGSLGHYFFTEPKSDSLTQKIFILRATQAGSDRSFTEDE